MDARPETLANIGDPNSFIWIQFLCWAFLTFNTTTAIYRAIDETWAVAFVAGSYLNLLLLFWCLKLFERTREGRPEKKKLKYSVWLLASTLTISFSYKVAAVMPAAFKVIVWIMAAFATAGGFYCFFIFGDEQIVTM